MSTETPIDYPTKLPLVSKNAPLYGTVKTAKRVIKLLLEHASGIEDSIQYYIGNTPINVPDKYLFGKVPVCFIPGWGAYTIGEGEKSIMLSLPEGREDLIDDVEIAKRYIQKLGASMTTSERRRIRESWQRDMTKKGRMR